MSEPIRARVAKILNSREIAISAGSSQGIRKGMYFDVIDPKGEDILDPDTGELLGSIEKKKVRVRITDVREKLSVGSTYKKIKLNVGGSGDYLGLVGLGQISQALMPPKWVTKYQTLKTSETTLDDLDEESSFVKTGDPVVEVKERIDPSEVDDIIDY